MCSILRLSYFLQETTSTSRELRTWTTLDFRKHLKMYLQRNHWWHPGIFAREITTTVATYGHNLCTATIQSGGSFPIIITLYLGRYLVREREGVFTKGTRSVWIEEMFLAFVLILQVAILTVDTVITALEQLRKMHIQNLWDCALELESPWILLVFLVGN